MQSVKITGPMAQLDDRERDRENVNEWIRFGMKLGVQSLLHPFEYSKVLIQVRKTLFTFSSTVIVSSSLSFVVKVKC